MSKNGTLGDIAEIISGYAFKSAWFGRGSNRVVRISDIQNNQIIHDNIVTFDSKAHPVSDKFKIREGDILMALSGATTGKLGIATNKDRGAYLNQRIAIVRSKNPTDSQYIRYVLCGKHLKQLLTKAGGAAQANLSPKHLATLQIPLPPQTKRESIGAILGKIDTTRYKRQEANQLTNQLLQSIFYKMFGDPQNNHHNYPICKIGDLVSEVKYGTSKKAGSNGQYPILRMGNISFKGDWDLTDLKFIDLNDDELDKYLVRKGDILFNRTNSKELVGKTAVYRKQQKFAYAGYLIRIRPNELATSEYISGFLNSQYGKMVLRNMCKAIVGMANINAKELQNIKIPMPPLEKQRYFDSISHQIHKLKSRHYTSAMEMKNLFESTLSRCFSNG